MKKTAYIWRESVYKNEFKCRCGNHLLENGMPINVILLPFAPDTIEEKYLYCRVCGMTVAKAVDVDVPENCDQMMGNYEDFMNGRRS